MLSKVDRKQLVAALERVKPSLSAQQYVPILTHFCLTAGEVYAYNDTSAVVAELELDIGAGVGIPEVVLQVVKTLGTSEVRIGVEDDQLFHVRSGRSSFKFGCLPPDSFLFEKPKKWKEEVSLSDDLISGIRACLVSVDSNSKHDRSALGVHVQGDSLYSSDGKTISCYKLKESVNSGRVILPEFFCQQAVLACSSNKQHHLGLGKDFAVLLDDDKRLVAYSRLIDSKDAKDYGEAVKRYLPEPLRLAKLPKKLEQALGRAVVLCGPDLDSIRYIVAEEATSLVVESNSGSSRERLDKEQKPMVDTHVSALLLRRAITHARQLKFSDVRLQVADEVSVIGCDKGTFMHLIGNPSAPSTA